MNRIFILGLIIFLGCTISERQLKEGTWKYGEGYNIGDWVTFDGVYTIHIDTINKEGKSIAVIIERIKRTWGDDQIKIQSLDKRYQGIYYYKERIR